MTHPVEHSLSRRQFLGDAAAAAGGSVLVPVAMLSTISDRLALAAEQSPAAADVRDFTLRAESFRAAPDGRSRAVWGYNQQLPGPVLRVKEGQTVRVKVVNALDVPTS